MITKAYVQKKEQILHKVYEPSNTTNHNSYFFSHGIKTNVLRDQLNILNEPKRKGKKSNNKFL